MGVCNIHKLLVGSRKDQPANDLSCVCILLFVIIVVVKSLRCDN